MVMPDSSRWHVRFDHDSMDCIAYEQSDDHRTPMLGPTRYCLQGEPACYFAVDVLAPDPPRAIQEAQRHCQRLKDDLADLAAYVESILKEYGQ